MIVLLKPQGRLDMILKILELKHLRYLNILNVKIEILELCSKNF